MKTIVWILVIWIVVSLIVETKKGGKGWMAPFKQEYKIQFENHPIITIIATILVIIILWSILF